MIDVVITGCDDIDLIGMKGVFIDNTPELLSYLKEHNIKIPEHININRHINKIFSVVSDYGIFYKELEPDDTVIDKKQFMFNTFSYNNCTIARL